MAETTNTDDSQESGGAFDSLTSFLSEPLGMGLAAGAVLMLIAGYMIL